MAQMSRPFACMLTSVAQPVERTLIWLAEPNRRSTGSTHTTRVSGGLATRTSGGIAIFRKSLAISDVSISQHIVRSLLKSSKHSTYEVGCVVFWPVPACPEPHGLGTDRRLRRAPAEHSRVRLGRIWIGCLAYKHSLLLFSRRGRIFAPRPVHGGRPWLGGE